jgi:hypothetical protein
VQINNRETRGVPYVLGDDLLGGVREAEVDEVGEGGHGRRRLGRTQRRKKREEVVVWD